MRLKEIKTIEYELGNENEIMQIMYASKEPLLIKIKDFPDTFDLDYFSEHVDSQTSYDTFDNQKFVSHGNDNFKKVLAEIKENKPHRIFGELLPRKESETIENHVPLWQSIPLRPRYFDVLSKVVYFFGGKDSSTGIHFDREQCCNLHLCLCGTKELLLFTEDQSDYLYKLPYIGDSWIDFGRPMDEICEEFPKVKEAEGYLVTIQQGDMVFLPRNCWHYTRYIDASAAATYIFFPKKFFHWYGYFTGNFYMAYKEPSGMKVGNWSIFKRFNKSYVFATGKKKALLKIIEKITYFFLLPILSIVSIISLKLWPRRLY